MASDNDEIVIPKRVLKVRKNSVAEERVSKLEDQIYEIRDKHINASIHKRYGMELLNKKQIKAFEKLDPYPILRAAREARFAARNNLYLGNANLRCGLAMTGTLFSLFFAIAALAAIGILLGLWFIEYFYHNSLVNWKNSQFITFCLFAGGWVHLVARAPKSIPRFLKRELDYISQLQKKRHSMQHIAEQLDVRLYLLDVPFIKALASLHYHLGIRDQATMNFIGATERQVSVYIPVEPTVEELAARAEAQRLEEIKALALERQRQAQIAAEQKRAAQEAYDREIQRRVAILEAEEAENYERNQGHGGGHGHYDDNDYGNNSYVHDYSYHPHVNVNGQPMIGNTGIDIHGDVYGSPNSW